MFSALLRFALAVLAVTLGGSLSSPAQAEAWPQRTVRIITPFNPGISPDAAARTLGEELSKRWKQPVIVENRPGGDTMIGARAFLDQHDDHALLFTTHSTLSVMPLLHITVPYDTERDFAPISLAVEDFLAFAVSPKLGAKSLSEFVQIARTKPGGLNFHAAAGAPYLAFLAFQKQAGISVSFIPYNSPPNVIIDLAEGRIHIALMPLASVVGAAQAGKINLLAVTNSERAVVMPDVPTAAESGFPDVTFGGYLGFFGSKGTPQAVKDKVADDVRNALAEAKVKEKLTALGLVGRGTRPAEFAALIDQQRAKWARIAKDNGVVPQP